jgi:hypothetical protein
VALLRLDVSVVFAAVCADAASCSCAELLVTTDFFSAQPEKMVRPNISTTKIPIKVKFFFIIIVPPFPCENKVVINKKLKNKGTSCRQ